MKTFKIKINQPSSISGEWETFDEFKGSLTEITKYMRENHNRLLTNASLEGGWYVYRNFRYQIDFKYGTRVIVQKKVDKFEF